MSKELIDITEPPQHLDPYVLRQHLLRNLGADAVGRVLELVEEIRSVEYYRATGHKLSQQALSHHGGQHE